MRCSVAHCNTDNGVKSFTSDLMLFRFPKDEDIQKRWVIACKRADHINVKTARVCSKHFDDSSYERNLRFELLGYTARNRRLLKGDAVPFLNLPNKKLRNVKEKLARSNRILRRNQSKLVETLLQTRDVGVTSNGDSDIEDQVLVDTNDIPDVVPLTENGSTKKDSSTNTEADERDNTIAKLKEEVNRLKNENKVFHNFFTPAQINKLKKPHNRITWTVEDILNAVIIHSAGAQAYRLLLKKGYPLPAESTLRAWCKNI